MLGIKGEKRLPVLRLTEQPLSVPSAVIRRHVHHGSTVISDELQAYMGALATAG